MSGNKKDQIFGGRPVVTFREEVDRRRFLMGAALVGVGTTYVATQSGDLRSAFSARSAKAAAAGASASAADIDILQYALTLERLEAEFYKQGIDAGILEGRELELVTPIRDHEVVHVETVSATITGLGGEPAESPMFQFPEGTFTDKAMFLTTAGTFEELGVKAYHGQVPLIESPEILAAAATIAGVESRHAAVIADLLGGNPFPAPIEASLPMEAVLEAAMPFIAS